MADPGCGGGDDKLRLRREALLAEEAASDAKEERRAAFRERKAARLQAIAEHSAACAGVPRAAGKAFLDACKLGATHEATSAAAANRHLLAYRGEGTSYAFTGYSGLHWAVSGGHAELAEKLLLMGARASSRNNAGATPLHIAAAAGKVRASRRMNGVCVGGISGPSP